AARERTGAAADAFRAAIANQGSQRTASLLDALQELPTLRAVVDQREGEAFTQAIRFYTDATAEGIALRTPVAHEGRMRHEAAGAATLVQLTETVARQQALMAGLPDGSEASAAVREAFAQSLALQRQTRIDLNAADLPHAQEVAYGRLTQSPEWSLLVEAETPDAGTTTPLPASPDEWRAAADTAGEQLARLATDALDSVRSDALQRANRTLLLAGVGGVVVLAALVAAVVLALRLTSSLT